MNMANVKITLSKKANSFFDPQSRLKVTRGGTILTEEAWSKIKGTDLISSALRNGYIEFKVLSTLDSKDSKETPIVPKKPLPFDEDDLEEEEEEEEEEKVIKPKRSKVKK